MCLLRFWALRYTVFAHHIHHIQPQRPLEYDGETVGCCLSSVCQPSSLPLWVSSCKSPPPWWYMNIHLVWNEAVLTPQVTSWSKYFSKDAATASGLLIKMDLSFAEKLISCWWSWALATQLQMLTHGCIPDRCALAAPRELLQLLLCIATICTERRFRERKQRPAPCVCVRRAPRCCLQPQHLREVVAALEFSPRCFHITHPETRSTGERSGSSRRRRSQTHLWSLTSPPKFSLCFWCAFPKPGRPTLALFSSFLVSLSLFRWGTQSTALW